MSDSPSRDKVKELTFERRPGGSLSPGRSACTLLRLVLRNRFGLTVIELVTVLLLLGVLSAIATKSMLTQKSRAMVAVVESDLRNLAVAQENHFAVRSDYYGQGGGASFASSPAFDFNPSPGVSVEIRAGEAGWAARAVHEKLADTEHACAIYIGVVEPYPPAGQEGVVTCRPNLNRQRDENDGRSGSEGGADGNKDDEEKDKKDKRYKKNNRDKKERDKNRNNRRDGDSIDKGTKHGTGDGTDGNDGSKEDNGTGMSDRTKQADGGGVKEEDSGNDAKRENDGGSQNKESYKGNGDNETKEDGTTGDGTGGNDNKDTSGKKDGKNDNGKGDGKGNGG